MHSMKASVIEQYVRVHVPNFRVATCAMESLNSHSSCVHPGYNVHSRHADFERWESGLKRWIDLLRSPSPPPSPPPPLPPPTTRVQHDFASSGGWCEPPSSTGGSVADAAGIGASLSDSSRQDLAGAKAPYRTTKRARSGSVGNEPDLQTLGADLYVSGEVTKQKLSLPPTVLIISPENSGAGNLAQEILKKYPENLSFESPGMSLNDVEGGTAKALERVQTLMLGHHLDQRNRYFLLYLNQQTWLGSAGSKLADQVRAARAAGIRVVLAHECDPVLGGCEFSSFFQTTPQDLIIEGLYARIAVAFFTGQHRAVSLCLLAREIGAVRNNLIKACVGGALTRLADAVHANRRGSTAEQLARDHGRGGGVGDRRYPGGGGGGGAAGKTNAAWCDRLAAGKERRSRSRRRIERSSDPEEEHATAKEQSSATAEEPLVAPALEAEQGRNSSFSQASSSAAPRSSGGSRGVSLRSSGGSCFAGASPAAVTPAGDETDWESGSDSQASASYKI